MKKSNRIWNENDADKIFDCLINLWTQREDHNQMKFIRKLYTLYNKSNMKRLILVVSLQFYIRLKVMKQVYF